MTDSVLTELNNRPRKIPKFQKACEGSKSSKKKRVLTWGKLEDDEYVRQYSQFYYQFHKTEGFTIDWEQFDYAFNTRPLDNSLAIKEAMPQ
uniref:Uncharacterized protein n=2 Tax=Noccaea caerulescens TaxID=107243 RepID=A0A1J3HJT5_NOCCA